MKYAVKEISEISKGTWKCVLEYWQGCRCGSNQMDIFMHQEKRPTKQDVVNVFLEMSN